MNSRSIERAVGLFVLGGLVCLSYFTFELGKTTLRPAKTIGLVARFASAAGLNSGAEILVAGVPVGNVGAMKLGKDFSALVELQVREDVKLPVDTMAAIRGRGLLGDKYVALTPGAEEKTLGAGDQIIDTESSVDIESLLSKFAFGSVKESKTPQDK